MQHIIWKIFENSGHSEWLEVCTLLAEHCQAINADFA